MGERIRGQGRAVDKSRGIELQCATDAERLGISGAREMLEQAAAERRVEAVGRDARQIMRFWKWKVCLPPGPARRRALREGSGSSVESQLGYSSRSGARGGQGAGRWDWAFRWLLAAGC